LSAGSATVKALGGAGQVAGAGKTVIIAANGTLTPGDSPGMLSVPNLTLSDGMTYHYEAADLVMVNGTLDLSGLSNWTLNLDGTVGPGLQAGGSLVLFTFENLTGTPIDPSVVHYIGFAGPESVSISLVGNSLVLDGVSVVPEPGTITLVIVGLVVAGWLGRRRRGVMET
jgi:hypothetical protein